MLNDPSLIRFDAEDVKTPSHSVVQRVEVIIHDIDVGRLEAGGSRSGRVVPDAVGPVTERYPSLAADTASTAIVAASLAMGCVQGASPTERGGWDQCL